jgi:hypothetical protein
MTEHEPSPATRQALRATLDTTRAAYHALLDALSPTDWRRRSAEPGWTTGALLWRTADAVFLLPRQIESLGAAPAGPAPARRFGWMGAQNTRLAASRAGRDDAAARYDRGHQALVALLDGLSDEAWDQPLPGAAPEETIPHLVAHAMQNVDAQLAAVRRSLEGG